MTRACTGDLETRRIETGGLAILRKPFDFAALLGAPNRGLAITEPSAVTERLPHETGTISHDEPRLRLRVRSGTVFTSTDEPTEEDLAYAQAGMVTIIRIAGHHSMATPLDGARAAPSDFRP